MGIGVIVYQKVSWTSYEGSSNVVDCIGLTSDRKTLQGFVNTVMDFRVL
jgi:hypothetical protein